MPSPIPPKEWTLPKIMNSFSIKMIDLHWASAFLLTKIYKNDNYQNSILHGYTKYC